METPNTRSRRKREQQEGGSSSSQDDGLSIRWEHNQDLRRAVLQATENDVIATPAPTQKTRPISSRFSPSSSSSTTPKPSSRPARKRPCRNNRSAPGSSRVGGAGTPASMSPATPIAGSSSLPLKTTSSTSASSEEGGKTRLALLLEQYEALKVTSAWSIVPDSSSIAEVERKTLLGQSKSLSELDLHRSKSAVKVNKPLTTRSNAQTPRKAAQNLPPLITHPNIVLQPLPATSPDDGKLAPARAQLRLPLSPIKTGVAPRIGLGSQHNPASNKIFARTNSGKAFKPPLLQPQQAVRSSPRRAVQVQAQAQAQAQIAKLSTPVRAPTNGSFKNIPTKRSRPQMPHSRSSTMSTTDRSSSADLVTKPPAHPFANFDVGENEPDGDTSFDSFDGMFESGGPEIELLFKQVDGSR